MIPLLNQRWKEYQVPPGVPDPVRPFSAPPPDQRGDMKEDTVFRFWVYQTIVWDHDSSERKPSLLITSGSEPWEPLIKTKHSDQIRAKE